jgi:hypothetical protein
MSHVPIRRLWANRHTIGTVQALTGARFAAIVEDEGGGLSPTLLKGGGRPAPSGRDMAR